MKSLKGFTLIELLVVITILGILAAVVMVAINPGERINEANDSGKKNDVGQVATALESYFTAKNGSYTGATSGDGGTLVAQGYVKRWPTTASLTVAADGSAAATYATLASASASCPVGQSGTKYWCYTSVNGQSGILCSAATPSTACN